ncbi:MAG: hypothetical protein Q8Q37_00705 [bacterium]|nr:hypothetical protein [bacterium]
MDELATKKQLTGIMCLKLVLWFMLYVVGLFVVAKFLIIFLLLVLIKAISLSVETSAIIATIFLYVWTFGLSILAIKQKYLEYTGQADKK